MKFKDYLLYCGINVFMDDYIFCGGLVLKSSYEAYVIINVINVWRIWPVTVSQKLEITNPVVLFKEDLCNKFAMEYEL